jgi:TFIIF-interacting CTD phosphatase-like protein
MKVDIFASEDPNEIVRVKNDQETELSLTYRPFMHEFLEDVSQSFELILYSSFSKDYIEAILERVEKGKKYFGHRFHDEFCIFANIGYSVKCIDFLCANRSPADIIVVESSVSTLPLSPDNLLPVSAYDGSPTDQELPRLAAVLALLHDVPNVPNAIKQLRTLIP